MSCGCECHCNAKTLETVMPGDTSFIVVCACVVISTVLSLDTKSEKSLQKLLSEQFMSTTQYKH